MPSTQSPGSISGLRKQILGKKFLHSQKNPLLTTLPANAYYLYPSTVSDFLATYPTTFPSPSKIFHIILLQKSAAPTPTMPWRAVLMRAGPAYDVFMKLHTGSAAETREAALAKLLGWTEVEMFELAGGGEGA